WMGRSRRDLVLQVPRHYGVGRGTFALRSPARPNPIAMSVVRLSRVEGTKLSVVGLDCLDETPLLDIKPYFASTDAVTDAVVGWHAAGKYPGAPAPVSCRLCRLFFAIVRRGQTATLSALRKQGKPSAISVR